MDETVKNDGLETTESAEVKETALTDAEAKENAEKEAKAKAKKKNKQKKAVITTTYFIAVLCLLAGLLVPIFNFHGEGLKDVSEKMMIRYIPAMFNNIFGREVIPVTGWFLPFAGAGGKFDFMSLVGVMYAIVVVAFVVLSVFVFLGSKKRNTSANAALIAEILAILVTGAYIASSAYTIVASGKIYWNDYNFLIPFGGVMLMAIIQTVSSKGGIGFSKVIAVIFSALGVFMLCDVTLFIPKLAEPLSKFSQMVKCGDEIGFVFGLTPPQGNVNKILGIDGLNFLLNIKYFWGAIIAPNGKSSDIFKIVVYILIIAISVFTLLNLVVDVIGLGTGKKYKKNNVPARNAASNSFALVRYILTFLFAAALVVMVMFVPSLKDTVKVGIYLYVLIAVLLIEIINAAIRTGVANTKAKAYAREKAKAAEQGEIQNEEETSVVTEPAYADAYQQPAYTEPAYTDPAYQQPAYTDPAYQQPAYTDPAYQQPAYTDPAYQQPAYTDPAYQQPAYTEPAYTEPAYTEPVQQPAYTEPAYTEPAYTEPVQQPAYTEPVQQTIEETPYVAPVVEEAPYVAPAPAAPVVEETPYVAPAPVAPVVEETPYVAPAPLTAPLEEPAETTEETPEVYEGETDAFMDTLSDSEKVEFVETFVKRSKGKVNGVDAYEINGDNSDFFPAVFVHINRYRNIVSDELMTKLYRQLGK